MKFDMKYKPELACSKDETRMALFNAHLDVAEKAIVATDGHGLVCLPCKVEDGEKSGPLPSIAIQWARKNGGCLRLVGKVASALGMYVSRFTKNMQRFPEWKAIDPGFRREAKGTVTVGLNPFLLVNLCKAMGMKNTDAIAITFRPRTLDPIMVENANSSFARRGEVEPYAIIMPCSVNPTAK